MKKPPADLFDAANAVLCNAYAPYSHFSVAASVRAENGEIFVGCNVENAAFPMGLCAEIGAISALFTKGYRRITEILILVSSRKLCPPCGACRQRFLECAALGTVVHLCTTQGEYQQITLGELFPHAFGPHNLE